jgi:hypothetical protein
LYLSHSVCCSVQSDVDNMLVTFVDLSDPFHVELQIPVGPLRRAGGFLHHYAAVLLYVVAKIKPGADKQQMYPLCTFIRIFKFTTGNTVESGHNFAIGFKRRVIPLSQCSLLSALGCRQHATRSGDL